MKRKIGVLFFALLAVSLAQHKDYEQPAMRAARGTHGAVAAGSEYAAEAGMRTFFHGGNAVDAGVATMFAASVSEFSHFGLGGEAPILIRTKAGKVYAIAGVGTMPKLATAKFFRERRPKPGEILTLDPGGLRGIIPVAGIMPALVPGMVEAGLVALRDFGTKSFNDVIQPAIELADSLPIDEMRSGSIARSRRFFDLWPDSKKTFLPNGQVPMPGELFHQPNLARTLRMMAAAEKKALATWREPHRRYRRGPRLLLPRRHRAPDRRVHAGQRRIDALRRHGWRSSCSLRSRFRPTTADTKFISRVSGARGRPCWKR